MRTRKRMGLSILAGGLAFVGAANATDLIVNGSFENPNGGEWIGTFGTYNYSATYYAGPPVPASENPGSLWSWNQKNGDNNTPLTQTVDLTAELAPDQIDAGTGQFTFSAWLASYTQNPEVALLTLQFFDATSAQVGSTFAFSGGNNTFVVTNADGTGPAGWTPKNWSKYVRAGVIPSGARTATVGITHDPAFGLSGNPDTYVDLVKLDVASSVVPVPPSLDSAAPSDGATGVRADLVINVALRDQTTAVNPNSIQFTFDGLPVTPSVQRAAPITSIQYAPPGLLAPLSTHTYRVVFSDNGHPVTTQTNQFTFTVLKYYNILLPPPIYLETFDEVPEGILPDGWTQVSYSDVPDFMTFDLGDLNSLAYSTWVVVDSSRFNSPLLTYNTHTPTTDYQRVLSFNPANVVNGAVLDSLAHTNIAFGDSGYRVLLNIGSEIVYLFSKDFDLTGRHNVYLSYHSLWEQNQDSIGAVEYSIDQGATWLPVVYMLDGPDVLRNGDGDVDPVATFSATYIGGAEGVATYVDPIDGQTKGGHYGAFIGVTPDHWADLGPYISPRVNDDPVSSKRVEVFRLPAADNQPTVRLRFAHAGTDSWYFGIDDVGLYSITTATPPVVTFLPAQQTAAVGNSATIVADTPAVGLFTYQWARDGVNIPNQTNTTLKLKNIRLSDAGAYSLVASYPGGSMTASGSVLTVISPISLVTGQWDFNHGDLTATCGNDLAYFDVNVEANTVFGTTAAFGISDINGQPANVMQFPYLNPMGGYIMRHGIAANGGGAYVNQYTLIMDILYPASSDLLFRVFLQTDPNNSSLNDGDFFINKADGIGVNGTYDGNFTPDTWHRVALAVDLAGPGPHPIVAKFIDGVKVGEQTLLEGVDGRWSMDTASDPAQPYALLLADNDGDNQLGYVSSIQIRSGRMSDTDIAELGGPSANKILGCIMIAREGGHIVIRWSGGTLQEASSVKGPWSDTLNQNNPQTVTATDSQKFYRIRL